MGAAGSGGGSGLVSLTTAACTDGDFEGLVLVRNDDFRWTGGLTGWPLDGVRCIAGGAEAGGVTACCDLDAAPLSRHCSSNLSRYPQQKWLIGT